MYAQWQCSDKLMNSRTGKCMMQLRLLFTCSQYWQNSTYNSSQWRWCWLSHSRCWSNRWYRRHCSFDM